MNATPHGLPAGLAGMPQERLMRVAARRAFVDMKTEFLHALDELAAPPDLDDDLRQLRRLVRAAQEPEQLWALQRPVFGALRRDPVAGPRLRDSLRQGLDSLFPPTLFASGYTGL